MDSQEAGKTSGARQEKERFSTAVHRDPKGQEKRGKREGDASSRGKADTAERTLLAIIRGGKRRDPEPGNRGWIYAPFALEMRKEKRNVIVSRG